MPLADRKRLPSSFCILFRNLPVRHACAALRLSGYGNIGHVKAAMRRGIANFLFDSLAGYHTRKDHLDSDRLRSQTGHFKTLQLPKIGYVSIRM